LPPAKDQPDTRAEANATHGDQSSGDLVQRDSDPTGIDSGPERLRATQLPEAVPAGRGLREQRVFRPADRERNTGSFDQGYLWRRIFDACVLVWAPTSPRHKRSIVLLVAANCSTDHAAGVDRASSTKSAVVSRGRLHAVGTIRIMGENSSRPSCCARTSSIGTSPC